MNSEYKVVLLFVCCVFCVVCFGVCCIQGVPEEVVRLIESVPAATFDSALLAGGYNLLTQTGLPCILACQQVIRKHASSLPSLRAIYSF